MKRRLLEEIYANFYDWPSRKRTRNVKISEQPIYFDPEKFTTVRFKKPFPLREPQIFTNPINSQGLKSVESYENSLMQQRLGEMYNAGIDPSKVDSVANRKVKVDPTNANISSLLSASSSSSSDPLNNSMMSSMRRIQLQNLGLSKENAAKAERLFSLYEKQQKQLELRNFFRYLAESSELKGDPEMLHVCREVANKIETANQKHLNEVNPAKLNNIDPNKQAQASLMNISAAQPGAASNAQPLAAQEPYVNPKDAKEKAEQQHKELEEQMESRVKQQGLPTSNLKNALPKNVAPLDLQAAESDLAQQIAEQNVPGADSSNSAAAATSATTSLNVTPPQSADTAPESKKVDVTPLSADDLKKSEDEEAFEELERQLNDSTVIVNQKPGIAQPYIAPKQPPPNLGNVQQPEKGKPALVDQNGNIIGWEIYNKYDSDEDEDEDEEDEDEVIKQEDENEDAVIKQEDEDAVIKQEYEDDIVYPQSTSMENLKREQVRNAQTKLQDQQKPIITLASDPSTHSPTPKGDFVAAKQTTDASYTDAFELCKTVILNLMNNFSTIQTDRYYNWFMQAVYAILYKFSTHPTVNYVYLAYLGALREIGITGKIVYDKVESFYDPKTGAINSQAINSNWVPFVESGYWKFIKTKGLPENYSTKDRTIGIICKWIEVNHPFQNNNAVIEKFKSFTGSKTVSTDTLLKR